MAEVASGQELRVVNIAQPTEGGKFSLAEATFGPDGNIILTTEDGTQNGKYYIFLELFHLLIFVFFF